MTFRRRFRRRRRATWGWADTFQLQVSNTAQTASSWLIPPGRVNWLCNNDRVPAIGFRGCHLWLDFNWVNTSTGLGALPDISLYAVVAEQIEATPFAPLGANLQPWTQPETPATMTSWEEFDIDGTDSFLWCHHIKGMTPPNYITAQNATGASSANGWNQTNLIAAGSVDSPVYICRKFSVAAEWQPDVQIRSRRTLKKDQGIALFMRSDTALVVAGLGANLNVRLRTLVTRGR